MIKWKEVGGGDVGYRASRFPADQAIVTLTAVSSLLDSTRAIMRATLTLASGTTSLHCGFSTKVDNGDL